MDGEALLAAIIATPDDDTARLVYADWLDENEQPERAEFIRAQVRLGVLERANPRERQLKPNDPAKLVRALTPEEHRLEKRADELSGAHGEEWVPRVSALWDWHRGFVRALTCGGADWVTRGDEICAAHPVTQVTVTTLPETDGDEDEIWFTGDPRAVRIAHVDALAEQTAEERADHNSMAALMRCRWRGVKSFVFPLGFDPADGDSHTVFTPIVMGEWVPPGGVLAVEEAEVPTVGWACEPRSEPTDATVLSWWAARSVRSLVLTHAVEDGPYVAPGTEFGPVVATAVTGAQYACRAVLTNCTHDVTRDGHVARYTARSLGVVTRVTNPAAAPNSTCN